MKIVVAGKGGAGKTTVSGTIARVLARGGREVVALDADLNPMLGLALGLGMDRTEELAGVRQSLQDGERDHEVTVEGMVDSFGTEAPDGVRIVIASRMDKPESQCACCGVTADKLLREIEGTDRIVLGDLEAGVGVLTRMEADGADVVLLVTNPTLKSIEVARRALQTAVASQSRVIVVANRVTSEADLRTITDALGEERELVVVPDDPTIARADVEGTAPIDAEKPGPGVEALIALGERLGSSSLQPA